MTRKTIVLTPELDAFVKQQVKSGDFGNDSEYLRSLIRSEKRRSEALAELRQAIEAGYSGEISQKSLPDIAAEVEAEFTGRADQAADE